MAEAASWVLLFRAIQSVISFQKEPEPTALGIRSEPSKRTTALSAVINS